MTMKIIIIETQNFINIITFDMLVFFIAAHNEFFGQTINVIC